MTDQQRAAMQAALEAIEELEYSSSTAVADKMARDAKRLLRAALAEPEVEQEPVYAFRRKGLSDDFVTCSKARHDELSSKPRLFETAIFYTAPPRRKWAPLTDEEIEVAWKSCDPKRLLPSFAAAIEAALERFANLVAAHERAALAEPMQKPVAWMDREGDIYPMPEKPGWAPPHTLLYAAPPRREWRGLTDEERLDTFHSYLEQTAEGRARVYNHLSYAEEELEAFNAGGAAAEAALKEKNHDRP